jgi:hypothetical protein
MTIISVHLPVDPILLTLWAEATIAGHVMTRRTIDRQTEQIDRLAEVGIPVIISARLFQYIYGRSKHTSGDE